jgi:hypothetical protein
VRWCPSSHVFCMTPALFLDRLFPPLKFNLNLSQRVLTHASHKSATTGHNARLSFIGRRVAQAYLHLFLDNSIHIHNHDSSAVAARTLHPHVLGEHVASVWNIQHALRWTPAQPPSNPILIHSVGLYKVHGEAVQAVLGAVFYQFVRLQSIPIFSSLTHLVGRSHRSPTLSHPHPSPHPPPKLQRGPARHFSRRGTPHMRLPRRSRRTSRHTSERTKVDGTW